jgi:hypothetical protein
MPSRRWITALAIAGAFVAGAGISQLTQREAHAQSSTTATLYVPSGGLVFRATDGTALARLSRDAHGGTFELFDDRHEVSTRVPRGSAEPAPNPYTVERDSRATTTVPDDGF